MILKIKRYVENRNWWLMDGVKRISSHKPRFFKDVETKKVIDAAAPDLIITDNVRCTCDWGGTASCPNCASIEYQKSYKVMMLGLRMEDGSDYLALFDTVAYVLNDQGKTIEKIFVNLPYIKEDGTKR
jgi:hypothetical protein